MTVGGKESRGVGSTAGHGAHTDGGECPCLGFALLHGHTGESCDQPQGLMGMLDISIADIVCSIAQCLF